MGKAVYPSTYTFNTDGSVDASRVFNLMMLSVEANRVIALRMMKLIRGGISARREAKLMVSEKIIAASEAAANLIAGTSTDKIVHRYRQHVARNAKRLGGIKAGQSRNRVVRRRRK